MPKKMARIPSKPRQNNDIADEWVSGQTPATKEVVQPAKAVVTKRLTLDLDEDRLTLTCVELDDNVSGTLMIAKPFTKHRKLSRAKWPFVVSAIKRFIQFCRIGRLFRFPASEAILKIDQSGTPLSRG
jgi:hypothetical protein